MIACKHKSCRDYIIRIYVQFIFYIIYNNNDFNDIHILFAILKYV